MSDHQEAQGQRRLVRAREGRMLGGVCAGLGEYTGTDPTLWRLGAVVAAICTGGLAIVGYIAAILIIPEAGAYEASA
jgi:phage shock protein C